MERALQAVRRARRRLVLAAGAEGAARGLLAGSLAALALAGGALVLTPGTAAARPMWMLVISAAGALVGAAAAVRRPPTIAVAALELDRAAHTDEAFLTALTAADARPVFRALSAEHALRRCMPRDVHRFLPWRAPPATAAAAVGASLVLAVSLIAAPAANGATYGPLAGGAGAETGPLVPGSSGAAAPPVVPDTSPRARIESLREAAARGDDAALARLAPPVRRDLAAASDDELRALATALAERGDERAEAARQALDALARGDRAAATDALRAALANAGDATAATPGGGDAAAPLRANGQAPPAPWSAPTWPLRYDRTVRRWTQLRKDAE